jgi:hypothetical protein
MSSLQVNRINDASGGVLAPISSVMAKRFNEVFEYRDGDIYWKVNPNNLNVGALAGTKYSTGYRRAKVDGKTYAVHRIIWTMFNGDITNGLHIDHINGVTTDNSIENLRLVTVSQNAMNRKGRKTNTGIPNVSFCKENKSYRVSVHANKKQQYLGFFKDLELAELVAIEARDKFHGKFARLGA